MYTLAITWHISHSTSDIKMREHSTKGSAIPILPLLWALGFYFSTRKNNSNLKCSFHPFKARYSGTERGIARWEERIDREKHYGQSRNDFPWCVMFDSGMEKKVDPGLVPSLDCPSTKFSQVRSSCPSSPQGSLSWI